jgi:Zn-dependent M16 (insulinase) family peptidase
MTPSAEGSFNFVSYLAGVTDEDLQKERDEILATDVQTVRKLAPMIKQITDSGIICAVGGEDKIESARENLSEIRNL